MSEETTNSAPINKAQIDSIAPDFEARTTKGLINLSDFRGRWLLFFSHPADFTPVCTSEFIALQNAATQFHALNCELLGLSIDSLYSHIAWIKDIEVEFGVSIDFPIVEDISMAVSRAYGMLHESSTSTATVRSVFFIDPEGYIRATQHYPMNVGRSVDEILRVLNALQITDEQNVATPQGWIAGDATVLPPPLDQAEANQRPQGKGNTWYYTPKEAEA